MHKLSIVGANSQIGTELCFLLRNEEGIKVSPVVRNINASAFLDRYGFSCLVANIADSSDAAETIAGSDLIVLAAFATGPPKSARLTNDALVENAVRYSNENARIFYLSSIAAFGGQVFYTREKLHAEKLFRELCRKYGKEGFVFRLGHVFGVNQAWTRSILNIINSYEILNVKVHSNRLSNILHTVTLKNAIVKCLHKEIEAREYYSLVNYPQWTWGEVFRYYAKGHNIRIEFEENRDTAISNKNAFFGNIMFTLVRYVTSNSKYQDLLKALLVFLPEKYELKAQAVNFKQRALKEIRDLEFSTTVALDIFDIEPVPGPFVPGLRPTYELLNEYSSIRDIFLPR